MVRSADRQVIAAVLVATLVVIAGCSGFTGGGGDGADGADDEDETTAPEGMDGGEETTAGGTGMDSTESGMATATDGGGMTATPTPTPTATPADGAGMGGFGDYQFSEGESYRYSVGVSGTDQRSNATWEVTDVSGDRLTVETSFSLGATQTQTQTFEGTQTEVFRQMGNASESFSAVTFLSLRIGAQIAEGRSLTVGNSWTVTEEDITGEGDSFDGAQVEVTGTDSYAGVECTNLRVTESGNTSTYCVNPDYPFALAVTFEDQGTDIVFEGTSTGDGAGSDGAGTTTTSTGAGASLDDVPGEVTNDIDGLTVVDHQVFIGEGTRFEEGSVGALIEVENSGGEPTEVIFGYSYELTLYDDSGTEIYNSSASPMGVTVSGDITSALQPGETATLAIIPRGEFDPDRIASYEITVTCDDMDDGVYCE